MLSRWLVFMFSDSDALCSARRKGRKNKGQNSEGGAGNKKGKNVDIAVLRLRAASRVMSGMTYVKAMLQDLSKKYDAWKKEEDICEVFQKADGFFKKGIEEADLQNHDCGDMISVVKLVYNILYRWNLITVLSVGSHSIEKEFFDLPDGKTEDVLEVDHEHCRKLLEEFMDKDPYLQEKAPNAKIFMCIDSKVFEKCTNSEQITAAETGCSDALTDTKTVIAALRRSMKAGSMTVSLLDLGLGQHKICNLITLYVLECRFSLCGLSFNFSFSFSFSCLLPVPSRMPPRWSNQFAKHESASKNRWRKPLEPMPPEHMEVWLADRI